MELNKYDPIKTLNTSRFDWCCRLRLQAVWKGVKKDSKEICGMNMILIDDSNSRIHAFASSTYCKDFLDKLKEGQVYVLSNFKVKDFLGDETYRPVRNPKHIYFTSHTKLEIDRTCGLKIDEYAFDLYYIGEFDKMADDNRFLIDVVGKIQNIRPNIISVKNEVEKRLMKFELFDGRFGVEVTLFDESGLEFEEQLNHCQQKDIFVIMCAAKLGRYEGKPNLTTYPATRLFINPDHYSVTELKQKFAALPEVGLLLPKVKPNIQLLSVKEIKMLKADFKEEQVKCCVDVKKVDDKCPWFYAKCTNCPKEIVAENKIYKCGDCKRVIPYPDKRFRVCTLCSDSTGSIAIIFLDEEVSRILDLTVFDIDAKAIEEGTEDMFPEILRVFEKKNYTITLDITLNHLEKGSTVYDAYEIVDKPEAGASFDPSTDKPIQIDDITMRNLETDNSNTPHTGRSSSRTRMRKDIEPIAFDASKQLPPNKARNVSRKKD